MSINITSFRNAKSLNSANNIMDVDINHPVYGWIPYTLNSADLDETINNDHLFKLIGSNFEPYVAPTQAELDEQKATGIRLERDQLLAVVVDPIVSNPLRWADMTAEKQAEWAAYRTALLNLTKQDGFPHNVSWPSQPV